jgi:hypothetical protein
MLYFFDSQDGIEKVDTSTHNLEGKIIILMKFVQFKTF